MEKETVDKRTITLYLGCGRRRHKITIPLETEYYDEWYEERMKHWNIEPKDISAVQIGPRTVVELYSSAFFYGGREVIKNPSYSDIKTFEIGCLEDHHLWSGNIRSFRLWDYDYYQKIHTVQQCTAHSQCKTSEYCLCPSGYARSEWCPKTGRFCLPKSRYLQSKPRDIDEDDLVNLDCLGTRIGNKKYAQFREITRKSEKCYGPQMVEAMCPDVWAHDEPGLESCNISPDMSFHPHVHEGFGTSIRNSAIPILLIALVLIYLCTKY